MKVLSEISEKLSKTWQNFGVTLGKREKSGEKRNCRYIYIVYSSIAYYCNTLCFKTAAIFSIASWHFLTRMFLRCNYVDVRMLVSLSGQR